MTFTKLSTTHKDGVRPYVKRINNKQGIHSPRAHDPDGPDIRRVLKTRYTSRVGCCVAAPVAQETNNFGFK
jgi:hypothetical protein